MNEGNTSQLHDSRLPVTSGSITMTTCANEYCNKISKQIEANLPCKCLFDNKMNVNGTMGLEVQHIYVSILTCNAIELYIHSLND